MIQGQSESQEPERIPGRLLAITAVTVHRLCNHGRVQKPSLGAEEFDPKQAIILLKKRRAAVREASNVNSPEFKILRRSAVGMSQSAGLYFVPSAYRR